MPVPGYRMILFSLGKEEDILGEEVFVLRDRDKGDVVKYVIPEK